MLGCVSQRLSLVFSTLLLAFGVGVVGTGAPSGVDDIASIQLNTTRNGFINVDRLAELCNAWPVTYVDTVGLVGQGCISTVRAWIA